MYQGKLAMFLRRNKKSLNQFYNHLKGAPTNSAAPTSRIFSSPFSSSASARNASPSGFRSFFKGFSATRSVKNMCTAAAAAVPAEKEGLKLLVTSGPHAQKMVGIWLFGSAAWVFSMVLLGGATRLTRSGLSMTDWKFTGGLPPLTDEEWLNEFEKYKQSPEYKRLTPQLVC